MDYGMIQGAVVSLKAAADIAVALSNIKTMSEVQAKAIELQQIILAAQSGALAAQSEQFALLQQIRDLEEEVANAKAWNEQKQRYALVSPWQGAVTYALKKQSSNAEPPHWICATCYENGRRSILNDGMKYAPAGRGRNAVSLVCPVCSAHIVSEWSGGPIERKYAEDITA
jgi:hypothetical protein